MNYKAADYFSHDLEFKLDKLPAKVSDRTNWKFIVPGIFFGAIMFLIGLYEMLNGFQNGHAAFDNAAFALAPSTYKPFVSPVFFDSVFMIFGLGMIVASLISLARYRKYVFDGKSFTIGYRNPCEGKTILKESLKNYLGVRFRIEFFQIGFISKNKYIIELYHKDFNKSIPLYISTSPKDIRRQWEYYAGKLKMPALINTEEGLISRDVKNLNKSVRDLAVLGYIVDEFDSYEELPATIAYVRKRDKIILKANKIIWDGYNILAAFLLFIMLWVLVILLANLPTLHENLSIASSCVLGGIILIAIIVAGLIMFRKEKLVIKKHKIVNTHKYLIFSSKHCEIEKNDIEAVEVTENPVTGRYFVSIISDDKTITFGSKMPINDLTWIKRFLIHEIIK